MEQTFENKIALITGGTGTIGSALVKELLKFNLKQIRVFSRDETKQYYLQEKLNYPANLRLLVGDIRDKERLDMAFQGVDIVFHAAALKHVPLCEYNPFEAVKTNIMGSQNIIDAALRNKVSRVIAVSTDKAVDPINIMGTTKLMMEKLFINANYYTGKAVTKFSCARFGNVAWSRGSVLPLWKKQAEKDGVIKITNSEMTRFFMSEQEAIHLILKAAELSQGGDVFIFKMPAIKIKDLAKLFIEKYFPNQEIRTEIIGERAGEKSNEELFNKKEKQVQFLENGDMYITIPKMQIQGIEQEPRQYMGFSTVQGISNYSSDACAGWEKIREII